MNNDILKTIIKTKLELVNYVINCLPPEAKTHAASLRDEVFTALKEITTEYFEKNDSEKTGPHVKNVKIE